MTDAQYGYDQSGPNGQPPRNPYIPAVTPQLVSSNGGYQTSCTKSSALGLAITILALTVACVICEIVQISQLNADDDVMFAVMTYYSYGGFVTLVWCIITGIVGILSARLNSKGLVITFMVLNILTCALFIWPLVSLPSASLVLWRYNYYDREYIVHINDSGSAVNVYNSYSSALLVCNAVIVTAAVILFIVSLGASIIGCTAVCCRTSALQSGAAYVTSAPGYVAQPQQYGQQHMMSTTAVYNLPPATDAPQYMQKA